MQIINAIEWGTIFYSIFLFIFLMGILYLVIKALSSLSFGSEKKESQQDEINRKLDRIIELLEKEEKK